MKIVMQLLATATCLVFLAMTASSAIAGGACAPNVCASQPPIAAPKKFYKDFKAQLQRVNQTCVRENNGQTVGQDRSSFDKAKRKLDRRLQEAGRKPSPFFDEFTSRGLRLRNGAVGYAPGCNLG